MQECKLRNLSILKMFFTNRFSYKYILDLDFLKDVRPVGTLIELRGIKRFDVLPSRSEWVKIEGHQSYWHPI
jgi:hypothetical protein